MSVATAQAVSQSLELIKTRPFNCECLLGDSTSSFARFAGHLQQTLLSALHPNFLSSLRAESWFCS